MDIFVKTSNKSKDYKWFKAENSQLQSPNIPNKLENLVDTEFESLVLYRESSQLILAITALKSDRTDNRTRPIRNSLIWMTNDSEEVKIRSIILQYLENKEKLEKQVADAITEKPEIKINYANIKTIGNNQKVDSNSLDTSNEVCKIGNLKQYKQELINEIKNDSLPEKDGLLIFITDSKSKDNITKENPWRGLSSQISDGKWINIAKENPVKNQKKPQALTSEKQFNLLSLILVIILIVSNVFWFYQTNQLNQRINELEKKINQIEKLQSVIDKLEQDVETAKTDLKKEIDTAKDNFEKAFVEAQKQFNVDISKATSNYKTKITEVKTNLDNSKKQLNIIY